MTRYLRWLLVPLLPAGGYVVAIAGAVALVSALHKLCPPELVVSGMCSASWYPTAELIAFAVAAAAGASLFVALPWLAAPSHRVAVARVAFLAGSGIASWFAWQTKLDLLAPAVSAIAAGAATVLCLAKHRFGKNAA